MTEARTYFSTTHFGFYCKDVYTFLIGSVDALCFKYSYAYDGRSISGQIPVRLEDLPAKVVDDLSKQLKGEIMKINTVTTTNPLSLINLINFFCSFIIVFFSIIVLFRRNSSVFT